MSKMKKEGHPCPKCDGDILTKEFSKSETVDWYLKCGSCKTVFFVSEGQRRIENKPSYKITLKAQSLASDNGDSLSPEYYIQAILDYLDTP